MKEKIDIEKRKLLKKIGLGAIGVGAVTMLPSALADPKNWRDDGESTWRVSKDGNTSFVPLKVNGPIATTLSTRTSNYTITDEDSTILADGTSNTVTITLPTAIGIFGRMYCIKCINNTFDVDVATFGSEEIDASTENYILNKDDAIVVQSDGSDWWIISNPEIDDNFSYKKIESDERKTIKENQQMIVVGTFECDGELNLEGELIINN